MNKKIILVDSSLDFSKFMEILKDKDNKVITFDYNSHKLLTKEKIDYIIFHQANKYIISNTSQNP